MHSLLQRQLEKLGLGPDAPPDAQAWARVLDRVAASYRQADENRALVERSMDLSSAEMGDFNGRLRLSNANLEARVARRTAALERANARIEFALRNANACSWNFDLQSGQVELSPSWAEMLGRPAGPTQTTFPELMALVPAEDLSSGGPAMFEALKGLRPEYIIEHRVRRADGSFIWIMSSGRITERDATSGKALRMSGVNLDITARKTAEAELQQSEARFRTQAELSSDWYWEQDAELRFVATTGRSERRGGITAQQHVGLRRWDLPGTQVVGAGWEAHQALLAERQPFYEMLLQRQAADGTLHYVRVSGEPIFDAAGAFSGYRGVAKDDTARYSAELALAQARDAAQAASRSKSEFLANMSHEIRTPMNAVIGLTHLALERGGDELQQDYLRRIDHAANALMRIINDILDLSKIEAGKLSVELADFDLASLLDDVASLAGLRAREKKLEFRIEAEANLPLGLSGDSTRIGQVLTNLCGNAVKFTQQGAVVLRARLAEDRGHEALLEFSVQDSGIGLSVDEQSRLFQPFSQADSSTTRKYGGTGLGLSISRQLVEMMGGRIWVQSEPGKGSRFFCTVLCGRDRRKSAAPAGVMAALQAKAAAEPRSVANLQGARLLLVEDDAVNQMVAVGMLKPTGAIVSVANNGREALERIKPGLFDLILMDMHMPVMDGIEATRLLRADPALAGLPIIAMTASAMAGDRERMLVAGMNDYIAKPVRVGLLYATLAKWVKAADSTGGPSSGQNAIEPEQPPTI